MCDKQHNNEVLQCCRDVLADIEGNFAQQFYGNIGLLHQCNQVG